MASCVRNILTKNYKNLIIGFQVTVENVGMLFLGQRIIVIQLYHALLNNNAQKIVKFLADPV